MLACTAEYMPATQLEQLVAAAAEYFPAVQNEQLEEEDWPEEVE